jgi:hypothetical protein
MRSTSTIRSFCRTSSTARTPLFAVAATMLASTTLAAPDAGIQGFVVGEATALMGDCGATIVQQAADSQGATVSFAVARAAAILDTTAEFTAVLSGGLDYLCQHEGLSTCDSAVASAELSAELSQASALLASGDLKSAAESIRVAKAKYDGVFSFGRASTVPAELRERFASASASLGRVAQLLETVADPAGFVAALAPALELSSAGAESMLAELVEIEPVQWPASFPAEAIVDAAVDGANFAPGTDGAAAIASDETKMLFADWREIGAQGVLDRHAGAMLLETLGEFGNGLRDGMYGLHAELEGAGEEEFWCEFKCQADADCGPCHMVKAGMGDHLSNPEQLWFNWAIVEFSLEIDAPGGGEATRDAIEEAIRGIAGKFTFGIELYIQMEYRSCVFSDCWFFDRESECEATKNEWIRLDLPAIFSLIRTANWRDQEWATAAKIAQKAADQWCAAQ